LTERAREFASRSLYPGSGSQNILRRIAEDLGVVPSMPGQPVESVRELPPGCLQKVV
jgi:hypothetical protein